MEEVGEVKKRNERKENRFGRRYGFEIKLRCVKLHLEEGLPLSLLSKEVGVSTDGIRRWVKAYEKRGEAGLQNAGRSLGRWRRLPGPVRKKIVEIKKREPFFGVQRISHLLKRVFFLSASPETVRRTLQEECLIVPSRKKHSANITRPRFFERSTPNQMWQGDIFTFRLGGRCAYLVGMIDDYSRYMVGLELCRSQTADQVIVEFWLQSRGFIKLHTPKKCHPISPLFPLRNRSVYSQTKTGGNYALESCRGGRWKRSLANPGNFSTTTLNSFANCYEASTLGLNSDSGKVPNFGKT